MCLLAGHDSGYEEGEGGEGQGDRERTGMRSRQGEESEREREGHGEEEEEEEETARTRGTPRNQSHVAQSAGRQQCSDCQKFFSSLSNINRHKRMQACRPVKLSVEQPVLGNEEYSEDDGEGNGQRLESEHDATSSSSEGCRQQSDGDGNRSGWVCCRACGSGRNREDQGGSMDETGIIYKRSMTHQTVPRRMEKAITRFWTFTNCTGGKAHLGSRNCQISSVTMVATGKHVLTFKR